MTSKTTVETKEIQKEKESIEIEQKLDENQVNIHIEEDFEVVDYKETDKDMKSIDNQEGNKDEEDELKSVEGSGEEYMKILLTKNKKNPRRRRPTRRRRKYGRICRNVSKEVD